MRLSTDPYAILGVKKDASDDELRSAFRKLAKGLHPDLHPGDKQAEERFKQVNAAYSLLSDPEKRARFDRGEIDASGAETPDRRFYKQYADAGAGRTYRSTEGFADFEDMGDVFSDLFGRMRGGGRERTLRGADLNYQLGIEFLEAVNGVTKRVTMSDGKTLDIVIPAGLRDGQTLRLKGQGLPAPNAQGTPGDALVEIAVKPHGVFRLEGNDIHLDLPVTLGEAVLGGKVTVPTPGGPVTMTIPKGSSSGTQLRLKGRGVPDPRTGGRGDQYVRLRVALPSPPDAELEEFVKRWSAEHPYNPRAGMEGAG